MTVSGNYTWSHCQGNYVDINQNGPPANETYTKPGDRNFDNGNCLSDRRQIFNATAVAQTPKFSNHTMQTLASSWTVSGIYRASSGAPLDIVTGTDVALSGTNLQRPNQISPNPYKDRSGRPLTQWVDPAAFAAPASGSYGNVGWCSPAGISGTPSVGGGITIGNSTALNSNTFGQIRTALDSRILQFALKYVF